MTFPLRQRLFVFWCAVFLYELSAHLMPLENKSKNHPYWLQYKRREIEKKKKVSNYTYRMSVFFFFISLSSLPCLLYIRSEPKTHYVIVSAALERLTTLVSTLLAAALSKNKRLLCIRKPVVHEPRVHRKEDEWGDFQNKWIWTAKTYDLPNCTSAVLNVSALLPRNIRHLWSASLFHRPFSLLIPSFFLFLFFFSKDES